MNIISILASAGDIEQRINAFSIHTVLSATLLLVVLIAISSRVIKDGSHEALKKPLFILIALTISLPSLLLMGSTVYINTISDSGGPVHWHTDAEFWVCGQEVELRDPTGVLSNKIGTSSYHEHDDKRLHLEGVVIDTEVDASLKKFMDITGGSIQPDSIVIPIEKSIFEDDVDADKNTGDQELVRSFTSTGADGLSKLTVTNSNSCGDSGPGVLQSFLIRYNKEDDTYTQTKLSDPSVYTMRDEATVPPGDCLIVEFDAEKPRTDKLCLQYGLRDSVRCVDFGVSSYNPELCNIREKMNEDTQTVEPTESEAL